MEPLNGSEVPAIDIHAPFTRVERMDQLADIDQDIASLLELTGKAIQSLGKQTDTPSTTANADNDHPMQSLTAEEQTQAFQVNMDKFLSILHSVDVRLKRQIWGLEEAGILKDKPKEDATSGGPKPVLEPNGLGMLGSLDVGWLNSRSNQVEREMEAELWTGARTHLETVVGSSGADSGGDVSMTD